MLLIKPYLGCNISCLYCYEHPYRKAHKVSLQYNLDLVLQKIEELYRDPKYGKATPCLHGGEVLCLPKKDVEALFKKIYELAGSTSIQTNATQIDDDFIEMFKKYKTSVGVSWDGPGDLSSFRPGTAKVGAIMKKLVAEKVPVSNIIVISKANAGTKKKQEKLKQWLLELKKMGVEGRMNPCTDFEEFGLSADQLKEFYLDFSDFMIKNDLRRWSPFIDIINGLKQKSRVCLFSACDIFSTPSATVILGDGTVSTCARTFGKNVLWKDDKYYDTRGEILRQVPQAHGGCQDCRFFSACQGGCPTAAIDNDWRNRTYICPAWKALFERYEAIFNHLDIPVLSKITETCGPNIQPEGRGYTDGGHYDALHGDHSDDARKGDESLLPAQEKKGGYTDRGHYDAFHGDSNHGDSVAHKDSDVTGHGEEEIRHGYTDGEHYDALHGDHLDNMHGDAAPSHKDHSDNIKGEEEARGGYTDRGHYDAFHGDSEHGDSEHGDSG